MEDHDDWPEAGKIEYDECCRHGRTKGKKDIKVALVLFFGWVILAEVLQIHPIAFVLNITASISKYF